MPHASCDTRLKVFQTDNTIQSHQSLAINGELFSLLQMTLEKSIRAAV
jgi:hypothetical protein